MSASQRLHVILNVQHGGSAFKLKVVRGSQGSDVAAALSSRTGIPAQSLVLTSKSDGVVNVIDSNLDSGDYVVSSGGASSQNTLVLHEMPISVNNLGCMILIKENGIKHEFINAFGKTRTPEFLSMNPFHGTPTLQDGKFTLWESNAIMRYVADKYGLDSWYPRDLETRAKIDQILDWRQSSLYQHIATYCYPKLGFGRKEERMKEGREGLDDDLAKMEKAYLKDGAFLGGQAQPTIADLAVGVALIFCTVHGKSNKFPKAVQQYLGRLEKAIGCWDELMSPLHGYIKSKQ